MELKVADIPLHKKLETINKENYRPLSLLSLVSEIFERLFYDQLYAYFVNIFSDKLAAYRPKYGCQHVLLKLIEDWKQAFFFQQFYFTFNSNKQTKSHVHSERHCEQKDTSYEFFFLNKQTEKQKKTMIYNIEYVGRREQIIFSSDMT